MKVQPPNMHRASPHKKQGEKNMKKVRKKILVVLVYASFLMPVSRSPPLVSAARANIKGIKNERNMQDQNPNAIYG
jgi:hypothetical protein